ncbi:MAG: methylmalonyl-CoA epimerase [Thermodesulfobacteriota bacterium]
MIEKISHIGIAVKSMQEALSVFEDGIGLEVTSTDEVKAQKVRVAFLPVGETRLELLEPTQDDSPIAKFLENRGEGIHHIALKVTNIEESLARMKEKGVKLINEEPVAGAHGTRIAFLHPKGTKGVMLELVEEGEHE